MSGYWERRAAQDMARAQQDALRALEDIEKLHRAALSRTRSTYNRIRKRFMSAYGLTREEAAKLLAQPCGREEYLKLLEEIGRLGRNNPKRDELMAKAASGAYAYRESVQTAMEDEIAAVTARLAEQEAARLEKHLTDAVQEQSLRAGFRIAKQTGIGIAFGGVNEELARQLIHRPWSGMDFSARVWKNREALGEALNDVLREGLVTGRSGEKIAQELSERMGVSMSRSRTLVRTETTHACGQADLAAYDEAGIERYRFLATLDLKTSRMCRKLDGKVYARKDAKPGVNFPPMHPNCRSTDVAEISEEELSQMKRWARDPVTGKDVHVPASMTYEEWLGLQEETYGEERIRLGEKMAKNEKRDKAQLEEYRGRLGKKHLPKDLASFQQMKYTEPEEWAKTKRAYATIGEIDGKPWADSFKKEAKNTYWIMRGEDVEMSGHALARYLQRRETIKGGYSTQQLAQLCRKPVNYRQQDGRDVRLYDGVAAIFSADTGEMVSFVKKANPKADWREAT